MMIKKSLQPYLYLKSKKTLKTEIMQFPATLNLRKTLRRKATKKNSHTKMKIMKL